MKNIKVTLFAFLALGIFARIVLANNITVTNVTLSGREISVSPHYTMLNFDLAWENSWRAMTDYISSAGATSSGCYTSYNQVTSSGTTFTVANTTGLVVGMIIKKITGSGGTIAEGTYVTSITDGTHFVVSTAPSANLVSSSILGLPTITVASTAGLKIGMNVSVISGTGAFTNVSYISTAGALNANSTITVSNTAGLRPGMSVSVKSGTGEFAAGTLVASITNGAIFEVTSTPSTKFTSSVVVESCYGTTVTAITTPTTFTVSALPITALSNNAVVKGSVTGNWDAAWVFMKYKVPNYTSTASASFSGTPVYTSAAGATSSGNIITVTSTTGLTVGMPLVKTGTTGTFAYHTYVTSITDATHFTVSAVPSVALSGTLNVINGYGPVTVSTTAGLRVGMPIKAADQIFFEGTFVTEVTDATHFKVSDVIQSNGSMNNGTITGYANWEHGTISTTGNTAPAGSTLTPASDGKGVFIYRSSDGAGTNSFTGAHLKWNYGTDNVSDNGNVSVQVYAIEMVYVPQGSFYLGSGGTETDAFYKYPTTTNPYLVTSENAITVSAVTDNLYYTNSVGGGDQTGPIPAAFPKGHSAFYCMKYEITQQQYVDFLNSLNYIQQCSRTSKTPNSVGYVNVTPPVNRNMLKVSTYGGTMGTVPAVFSSDYPSVTCNYLCWPDLSAYLDWSGLRPMTELEFEKSCRGTIAPVANEYAWGTTGIARVAYMLGNTTLSTEVIGSNYSPALGNAAYITTKQAVNTGPYRSGIFCGTTGNTGRVTSGSTFYGIMEMSGNLLELAITVGNSTGRSFTGLHGNGTLDYNGNGDVSYWPAYSTGLGMGTHGGSYNDLATSLRISNRANSAPAIWNTRSPYIGGRGVRTAP
ncbi:MAG: SUMF1/EgtB/PvdO family nonheme iron enzyme [Ignavibacteria bacterium]